MTAKFTDKDLGWTRVMKGAAALASAPSVSVGFYDEHNATKASANEYGSKSTPERPFMRTALDANANKYFDIFEDGFAEGVDGDTRAGTASALEVGIEARNDIIESIQSGAWTPNAPSTVKAKGSSKPLVDTGELQRAVNFKVGDDEGGE